MVPSKQQSSEWIIKIFTIFTNTVGPPFSEHPWDQVWLFGQLGSVLSQGFLVSWISYGRLWGTDGRPFNRESEVVRSKRISFKEDLTEKMFGTGQNRSFKRGVRLSRVFARQGSTVPPSYFRETQWQNPCRSLPACFCTMELCWVVIILSPAGNVDLSPY